MTSSRSGVWQPYLTFHELRFTPRVYGKDADALRSLKAADKNTNERSQVENVSTVLLIDLTDTSSVREVVAGPHMAVCGTPFVTCLFHSLKPTCIYFPIPSLFRTLALSKYCLTPFVSFACPFICHSVQPHFLF